MTKRVSIWNNPFAVGFEDIWEKMNLFHDEVTRSIPNYPPFNLRKIDDNKFVIELAVAGFARSDIDIELDDGSLKIKGKTEADSAPNFLYKGIASRSFERKFSIADNVTIENAHLVNGMLRIILEKLIPDYKKPKKIEISDDGDVTKEFLAE